MPEGKVLVVDDEAGIQKTLRAYLERDGYQVESATSGDEALPRFREFRPDVVILDVLLPGIDGVEVLRLLRQESDVLVLMLSALGEETDRLVGLRMGADDYIAKPFSPREIAVRVGVLLRRRRTVPESGDDALHFAHLTIDPGARRATMDGRSLALTPIEFDLLYALALNNGRVLSRDQLIERAWGTDYFIDERVVDVHIRRLRRKLHSNTEGAQPIETVRGAGYRFDRGSA